MAGPGYGFRLASVDAIRSYQRQWLADTREAAIDGGPFVICTSDEFEDFLNALGIPAIVINYWNYVIVASGNAREIERRLVDDGFAGPHFFALGYGATLHPELAPWGGLPKPTALLGPTRKDFELVVTELWAKELGCEFIPLDFNFSSVDRLVPPDDWWRTLRHGWEQLVDQDRLALRLSQNRSLLEWLEAETGQHLTMADIDSTLQLVNQQMDVLLDVTRTLSARNRILVTFKDQLAAYQTVWHRGTSRGLELSLAYRNEIEQRAADGFEAYPPGTLRVLYWSTKQEPEFHRYLFEQHRAAIVGSPYNFIPEFYAREAHGDAFRALTARQLFLFDYSSPSWLRNSAEALRADVVIALERDGRKRETMFGEVCRQNEIPFLSLPSPRDTTENRARIDEFFSSLSTLP